MKDVIGICNELLSNNSRIEKENILEKYKNNKLFVELLKFMYNPMIVTGLDKNKLSKNILLTARLNTLEELMNYCKTYNTGTDNDISIVKATIKDLSNGNQEYIEFLENVVTKNLKLGITAKTLNKVYGDSFIEQWEVQQAYAIDKYNLKDNEWFCLTEKLNGVRATYYNDKLINRQGREIIGCQHIIDEIKSNNLENVVLDGELIRKNIDKLDDNENFRLTTGIVNSKDDIKSELELVVFDVIKVEEFNSGESKETYKDRRLKLNEVAKLNLQNIKVADIVYEGVDKSKIDTELIRVSNEGKEGLMLNLDTTYKRKRHKGILKIKKFYIMDLKIVGFDCGKNKYANTLGSLIVDYKGNKVGVGTGLTDEDRQYIWDNQDELLGRVVEVKYKEISKDKTTNAESLQFPVFCGIREIGKEVSYE